MLFARLKNKKLREKYYKLETKKKINKFIKINLLSNLKLFSKKNLKKKKEFILSILYKKKFFKSIKIGKNNIIRRCLLTNRSKGITRLHNLSRSVFRNLLSFGIVPGYKKAVW